MRSPLSRRKVLASASIACISWLTGCLGGSRSENPSTESAADGGEVSLGSYSTSSSSYPNEREVHSGWVHIVSDGKSADLTFDARLCTELGEVKPELTHSIGNEFVLRFNASAEFSSGTSSDETPEDSQCSSVTRLVGGANVPSNWETLTVAVNNIEIQTIERSGTMPEFRPLPDPVHPQ